MAHDFVIQPKNPGQRTVYSEAEEREIARKVGAGEETKASIARRLGVHRNTVANICDRHPDLAKKAAPLSTTDHGA
jgi:transposase-like protein